MSTHGLVIKVTSGLEDAERSNQAFTVAATALTADLEVSLWLTGEASWFGLPGRAAQLELDYAAAMPDLLESILAGGSVTVCTQCAARRGIATEDLIEGIRIAGAAAFIEEITRPGVQALVY